MMETSPHNTRRTMDRNVQHPPDRRVHWLKCHWKLCRVKRDIFN